MNAEGEWFTSSTKDGRIVGISSAKLINKEIGQIDGFANSRFQNCWNQLMNEAIKWVSAKGVKRIYSKISVEDEEKQAKFSQKRIQKQNSVKSHSMIIVTGAPLLLFSFNCPSSPHQLPVFAEAKTDSKSYSRAKSFH